MKRENFEHRMTPTKLKDGTIVFDFPMEDKKLDLICAEDIGKIVLHILMKPKEHEGKCLNVASISLTGEEIARLYSKITGETAVYKPMTLDQFRTSGKEFADILANMFQFYQEFEGKLRDIETSRKVIPDLLTFDEWITQKNFRVQ
jgi:uncharacterized protein YbjT (DUF2867 family)